MYFQYGVTTNYGLTTGTGSAGSGTSPVAMQSVVTGINSGTLFHYRMVASNAGGTTYGNDMTFTTTAAATAPTVQTLPATSITTGSAVLNARITNDGGSSILERRFSYGTTPACSDGYTSAVTVNGNDFYWTLTELPPGTLYYYQAWARNSTGWSNSTAASFTTLSQAAPTVQTLTATSVTTNSAQMNATVNPNGENSGYYFQYGSTTNYGSSSSVGNAGSGTSAVAVNATLLGLTPGSTYHYRIVGYNGGGTSYGSDVAFTASSAPNSPTATTLAATSITSSNATLNGTINPNGQSVTANFQYGTTTSYGTGSPLAGPFTSAQNLSFNATGLLPNTTYHYRMVVWGSSETIYGSDMQFTTSNSGASTSLTVASPNGGENWSAGSSRTITWSVSGPTNQINYFWTAYSLDGGATFNNIVTANAAARSATWSIPSNISSSRVRVRVRALDAGGYILAADTSDSNFTIALPGSTIFARPDASNLAPNSGATVTFYGGNSTPSSGASITSYSWNFGDGTTSSGVSVGHAFSSTATTTNSVRLIVTDSASQSATNWVTITVTGSAMGPNTQQSKSTDPVNLATGNFIYDHTDLKIPGRGIPLEFKRAYNSKDSRFTGPPLGPRWTHSYNMFLSNAVSSVVVVYGDARSEAYTATGGGDYQGEPGVHSVLHDNGDGTFTLTTKDQIRYNFGVSGAMGRLNSIVDKNDNTIALNYDGTGNLTYITDTVGRTISFVLDGSNRITHIIDPLSRTNQFAYNASGDLISATDARGGTTHYEYDANHQMTAAFDPNGNRFVQNVYDDLQRVVQSQQDALRYQTTFEYDFVTRITTVTDALNQKTYHAHDSLLRVISITDPLGNAQVFEYDSDNNRTKVIDKKGKATTYAYDANGNVISKVDPALNLTTIFYDHLNNPTNRTDALGFSTRFLYDAKGNLTNTVDALGHASSISYSLHGEPLTVTDANGNTTTNVFNSLGLVAQTRDPLGNRTAFVYDVVGRKTCQTNANNRATTFTYDNNDNLLTVTDPLGHSVINAYDANNNRTNSTDALGLQTIYGYDAKDRLVSIRDPLNGVVSNVYDALDRKTKVIDPRGHDTRYDYDAVGNLVRIRDALSHTNVFLYDSNGNRTNTINALGRATTYVYDDLNQLVQTIDPLGNVTKQEYDVLGRRTKLIDANSRTNRFDYDAVGRLTLFTDAKGGTVSNAYDNVGNRIASKDPNNHFTTFEYDAGNRLIVKHEPIGNYQYGYDGVGNRTSMTDANGQTISYAYDWNNRLKTITYPAGAPVTFDYDPNGNRTVMTDGLGTSTFQYDALNRMTNYVNAASKAVGYGYDANGNRNTLIYPDGKIVAYYYDPLNRLSTVTDWQSRVTSYVYDDAGNLIGSSNPNSTVCDYNYDAASRLVGLTNAAPDSSIISGYRFTLDGVGSHLQSAQTEPLSPVIPTQNIAYSYDGDNRLTNAAAVAYQYDANGNMTQRGTDSFAYDLENRLTQATVGTVTNQYHYDGAGNRFASIRNGVEKRFILDVNRSLSQVLAETDSDGNISAYYLYGLGLVAKIQPDNIAYYYHFDSRGSTVALSDGAGTLADKYAYDPFGVIANSERTMANPYKYVGRYGVMDEGNGLAYIRARYYSPEAGRFLTKDPLNGKDGDSQNLHRYVYGLNNPVVYIDPSGWAALYYGLGGGLSGFLWHVGVNASLSRIVAYDWEAIPRMVSIGFQSGPISKADADYVQQHSAEYTALSGEVQVGAGLEGGPGGFGLLGIGRGHATDWADSRIYYGGVSGKIIGGVGINANPDFIEANLNFASGVKGEGHVGLSCYAPGDLTLVDILKFCAQNTPPIPEAIEAHKKPTVPNGGGGSW